MLKGLGRARCAGTIFGLMITAVLLIVVTLAAASDLNYTAKLTKNGMITVTDETSGRIVHELTAPQGVIREIHVLDNGNVVATTKAALTEFWNAETGEKIQEFGEHIYAFSHEQQLCVTFDANHNLILRNIPDLSARHILLKGIAGGPSAMKFSPDDRYLAVEFCNHHPLTDEEFLDPVFDKTIYWVTLFETATGLTVPDVDGIFLGSFSADSKTYTTAEGRTFDLITRTYIESQTRKEE